MMGSDEPSGRARRPTSSIPRNILAERRIAARAQVDPVRVAETFALSPRRERVQVPLRGAPGEIHATAAAGRPEVYDSSIWNGDLQTSSLGRRRASSSLAAATRHRHASAGETHQFFKKFTSCTLHTCVWFHMYQRFDIFSISLGDSQKV